MKLLDWIKALFLSYRNMKALDWIKALSDQTPPSHEKTSSVTPTTQEMQLALNKLDELAAPAILGALGGSEPQKDNRASSWWGGNFLGAQDEDVPVCQSSGQAMHPLLQIRVDELPEIPASFQGIRLINIWMDLECEIFCEAENGDGFCVRAYADIDALVPLGFGYGESPDLPTFPILWRETVLEQPSWQDIADKVPPNVARASADDWFSKSKYLSERYDELRSKCPIKVGGWPTWIQGTDWPESALFLFQVDSTDEGEICFGDVGSIYIFRTTDTWVIRGDCY